MLLSSPGLSAIFNELKDTNHNHILDLGEMRGGTFQFFSKLACKFHFENLKDFIIETRNSSNFIQELDGYLTQHPKEMSFDVILLWDFINFLSIEELSYLFEKLKPYCKANTLVHSLTYMTKSIPESPSNFQVKTQDILEVNIDSPMKQKKSIITTAILLKSLPEFMIETNLFNKKSIESGITEHLLRYTPHLKSKQKTLLKKNYNYEKKTYSNQFILNQKDKKFTSHFSPGLIYIIKNMKKNNKNRLLNLGKDITENNNFLSKHVGQVTCEDLSQIIKYSYRDDRMSFGGQNLLFDDDICFDGILVWDLMNYLNRKELEEMYRRLCHICRPGTLIHVMSFSKIAEVPKPGKLYIQPSGYIELPTYNECDINTGGFNTTTLLKTFTNAKIKKSFTLIPKMAKGINEYILECQ